jgi:hypothetical protein
VQVLDGEARIDAEPERATLPAMADPQPPDTITRHAPCSCGRLRVEVDGEPARISVCHCLECQRRTGTAFGT